MAEQSEKDPDRRVWMLLAVQRVVVQGDAKDEPEERAKRLAAALTDREQQLTAAPQDGAVRRAAHNTAREIVLLYDADPADAVKAVVTKAKALAEQSKGQGG